MAIENQDIFSYIKSEEANYALPIQITDTWEWGMSDHIEETVTYKNSQLMSGKNKGRADEKPVMNIIRPILNLQYRAEGFDVKDIELFVDEANSYFKSFLLRKYHDKWAREQGLDTYIDELVASYIDFGGVLTKKVKGARPEIVEMQSIAFCDQTDILSGTIGLKHFYSPDQLKEMEKFGWGDKDNGATITIDELIILSENEKSLNTESGRKNRTTGKYIEIYEVHGTFPDSYLDDNAPTEEKKYSPQLHIVGFYSDENGRKEGVTLFKGVEKNKIFKFLSRDKIYNRALGMGGAEELFEAQVWTNFSIIKKKDMLESASKTILQTADPAYANRNKIKDMDNLEITVTEEGKPISQVDTFPRNLALFNQNVDEWQEHARQMGGANEAILGESPKSGTPFALQQLVTAEAHSLHTYRKGILASFLEEIYREWIIPQLAKDITKDHEFIAQLDLDELEAIAKDFVNNKANKMVMETILNGQLITPEEIEQFKMVTTDTFMEAGERRFLKILKDDFKKEPINVKTNIVGKQKYMAGLTDKLVNVFRQMLSTYDPATKSFTALDDPRMSKIFNEILESSGLSPVSFYQPQGGEELPQAEQQQQPQQPQSPQLDAEALITNTGANAQIQ